MGTDFDDGFSLGEGFDTDVGDTFDTMLPDASEDSFGNIEDDNGFETMLPNADVDLFADQGGINYTAGERDVQDTPSQSQNSVPRRSAQAPVQNPDSKALPNPNARVTAPQRRSDSGSRLTPEQREQAQRARQRRDAQRAQPANANGAPVGGRGNQAPSNQQGSPPRPNENEPQNGKKRKSRKNKGNAENGGENNPENNGNTQQPKKKKPFKKVLVGILALGVLGGGGFVAYTNFVPKAVEQDYNTSGKKVYDDLEAVLHSYTPESVDAFIGAESGDSYLAQEWSYANTNYTRETYIKFICTNTTFSYPQVEQLSTKGKVITDKSGNPVLVESPMNNGEPVIVTLPDFAVIAEQIESDADKIDDMAIQANIKDSDYDYQDKCFDLLLNYIMGVEEIPFISKECTIPIAGGKVTNDSELDTLMFASEDFRLACDAMDKLLTGFTGTAVEKYMEKEEVHNPEYDEWYKIFKERYDADKGIFNKHTSLWEPWYVYDENNILQYDENGNRLVRYYSVKDADGKDWIQPSKTIWKDVEKEHEVPVEYIPEKAVPYCFLGAWYAQNMYDGTVPSAVRVGTGTIDNPAGVGTPIITRVLAKDGKYHDVKVAVIGYWVGKDAIDYAVKFSEKNRGFDPKSPVQLICYEVQVFNLEDTEFTFDSEMMLCDKSASRTGRTGTMYSFNYEDVTLKPKGSAIFNDWATSTEIEQKYVAWGKSFNRQFDTVFFMILAGTGEVPEYSAYKEFTGTSVIDIPDAEDIPADKGGSTDDDEALNEILDEELAESKSNEDDEDDVE